MWREAKEQKGDNGKIWKELCPDKCSPDVGNQIHVVIRSDRNRQVGRHSRSISCQGLTRGKKLETNPNACRSQGLMREDNLRDTLGESGRQVQVHAVSGSDVEDNLGNMMKTSPNPQRDRV